MYGYIGTISLMNQSITTAFDWAQQDDRGPVPVTIVLVDPQIPPNTGNIARLCGANGIPLHLVGELGFSLSDKQLKRAGLDYWESVQWSVFPDKAAYLAQLPMAKSHFFSTQTTVSYFDHTYTAGDYLVFGSETAGLGRDFVRSVGDRACCIPMVNPSVRSLNLATSVGIGVYEAFRQIRYT